MIRRSATPNGPCCEREAHRLVTAIPATHSWAKSNDIAFHQTLALVSRSGHSQMVTPKLELAFEAVVDVGNPVEVGVVPDGIRRLVPINGGTFRGPGLKGIILPGGADHQVLHSDGLTQLDARYVLQTDQGSKINVVNRGIRHGTPEVMAKLNAGERVDPRLIYFRTAAELETAAPELRWMNQTLFVCVGQRYPTNVVVRFFKVL